MKHFLLTDELLNKAIEEICGKSSFSRLAALWVTFLKKQKKKKRFQVWSRGVYVLNYRSISFFVWSGGLVQINKPTYPVKIKISSTGCSLHVDFDNINYN